MTSWMMFLSLALLVTSCSKDKDSSRGAKPAGGPSTASAPAAIVLKVEGMQRGEGGKT